MLLEINEINDTLKLIMSKIAETKYSFQIMQTYCTSEGKKASTVINFHMF